jgi:SH3-like domain-containing protein
VKKINKYYLFFLLIFFANLSFASEDQFFLSLKKNEVNLRQGPSLEYPIKLIYKKKYLPVIILDKSGPFRKIRDFENNTGWIHVALLAKKKTALNKKNNSILFKKPTIYSKPIARLETGRLVLINKCNLKWCKITSGDFNGWIDKNSLWGNVK